MGRLKSRATLCVFTGLSLLVAACGGGGGTSTPPPPTTYTLTVNSVNPASGVAITVTPADNNSASNGTTSFTRTYNTGTTVTLTAPSTSSGGSFSSWTGCSSTSTVTCTVTMSGTESVTANYVAPKAPTVTVTPSASSITVAQSVTVTIAVTSASGPTPTGTVTLSSGTYTSSAATLSAGSASIVVPGTALAVGADTLTASYTPDATSSSLYTSASGTSSVTVAALITPTVTVTPTLASVTTAQSLNVNITVSGGTGNPTPTGTVTLTSGTYSSAATTLSSGSASITIPADSLDAGTVTLTVTYTPDTASSIYYNAATGTASELVALIAPTVTVTPATTSITSLQSLSVTVAVAGSTGQPKPTGSVNLTSGTYSSGATTLSSGSATITVPAGKLAAGSDTLSASYIPDAASSEIYSSATGKSSAVTVAEATAVTVNQSSSGPAVTNQLLGMNLAAWFDSTQSFVVPAFKAAGIQAMRWPGGSWSDIYHWNGNFTCYSSSGKPPFTPTGYADPNAVYTDVINDLQIPGGFDVALTADYGTDAACTGPGDPTEASGWVQAWETAGGKVSHVTVGNEQYGTWETDLHTKPNDPGTYSAAAQTYYSDIKAVDSHVLVGVDVDAGTTQPGWDTTVLSTAKGSYDFVEFHYYPQYGNITSDTYLVNQAALDFTKDINTLKSELATAGEPDTPIYVGEIGANSSNPGTQSWSITQGLYAGEVLGEAMNDGISRLTWWIGTGNCLGAGNNSPLLYGWQNTWGSYDVFSDADPNCPGAGPAGTMSPTGQAFNLFQNVLVNGENVLTASVTGDTTDVRAYAATHSGGTALVLFNLNETTSEDVQITLSGETNSSDVQITYYDKSIYDQSDATTPVWAGPKTTDLGAQTLPMTLTLTPWSMNVVIIK